ncbi:hypothetical protein Csa_023880, partial [Cucumis sativus]
ATNAPQEKRSNLKSLLAHVTVLTYFEKGCPRHADNFQNAMTQGCVTVTNPRICK